MTNYLSLPIGDGAPNEVNAVIEIPRGTTNKYESALASALSR
jgi:inorganic pyrophosphatase